MKLITLSFSTALALVAFALMMTLGRTELKIFLPSLVALILLLYRIFRTLGDKSSRIIGRELRGTVVGKQEKSEIHDKMITGSYGSFSDPRPYEHGRVRVLVSTVYVKTEDGSVVSAGKFNEDQTLFLELGDEIVIPKYGNFPLVLNESESRQKWLCPICGTVSPDKVNCPSCGFDCI